MTTNTIKFFGVSGANYGSISYTKTQMIVPRKGELIRNTRPDGNYTYMSVQEVIYDFRKDTQQVIVIVLVNDTNPIFIGD